MSDSTFLLVPTEEAPPIAGWATLDRAARLIALTHSRSALDTAIRARLAGFEVSFLEGAGVWTATTPAPTQTDAIRRLLSGLPVEIAEESSFTALI